MPRQREIRSLTSPLFIFLLFAGEFTRDASAEPFTAFAAPIAVSDSSPVSGVDSNPSRAPSPYGKTLLDPRNSTGLESKTIVLQRKKSAEETSDGAPVLVRSDESGWITNVWIFVGLAAMLALGIVCVAAGTGRLGRFSAAREIRGRQQAIATLAQLPH